MRTEILAILAAVALGTTGALAQTTGESPPDPTLEQKEQSADPSQPAAEPEFKRRMPMRREQPIVPDPNASSEGAGEGTSGSELPSATEPEKAAPSATEPEKKEYDQ